MTKDDFAFVAEILINPSQIRWSPTSQIWARRPATLHKYTVCCQKKAGYSFPVSFLRYAFRLHESNNSASCVQVHQAIVCGKDDACIRGCMGQPCDRSYRRGGPFYERRQQKCVRSIWGVFTLHTCTWLLRSRLYPLCVVVKRSTNDTFLYLAAVGDYKGFAPKFYDNGIDRSKGQHVLARHARGFNSYWNLCRGKGSHPCLRGVRRSLSSVSLIIKSSHWFCSLIIFAWITVCNIAVSEHAYGKGMGTRHSKVLAVVCCSSAFKCNLRVLSRLIQR